MKDKVLIIACGAIALELNQLKKLNSWDHLTIQCLDAELHNTPKKIPGKIKEKLGWEPSVPFESGINQTIQWYCDHLQWIERINNGQYRMSK